MAVVGAGPNLEKSLPRQMLSSHRKPPAAFKLKSDLDLFELPSKFSIELGIGVTLISL